METTSTPPFKRFDKVKLREGNGQQQEPVEVAHCYELDPGTGNWWFAEHNGKTHPCRKFIRVENPQATVIQSPHGDEA